MLMEGVPQQGFVLEDPSFDLPQFVRTHTTVACPTDDRLEPELALALRCTDKHMRRFEPYIRVKVKTEASDAQRLRYRFSLSSAWLASTSDWSAWSDRCANVLLQRTATGANVGVGFMLAYESRVPAAAGIFKNPATRNPLAATKPSPAVV
jgi:hypothetical protein